MNRPLLTTAILAALAALVAAWFFANYERVPNREWIGYQGEARRNSFLAAERLLARMGVSVRHAKTSAELRELPAGGTLIMLVGLAVWGTIWGIVGMFLAVPLMVVSMIVFSQFQATRPIAVLMSAEGELRI